MSKYLKQIKVPLRDGNSLTIDIVTPLVVDDEIEKGLVKALEPYVKTDEDGYINPNLIPVLLSTSYSLVHNIGSTSDPLTTIDIWDDHTGKKRIGVLNTFRVYDGNRDLGNYANFVREKGLKKVLESYPKLTDGLIPAQYLPSYVDDVLEFESLSAFPTTGETGKIYVDTTENRIYRWSGTQYTEIGKSLALGETSSTAYAGDKGAANATKIIQLGESLNQAISDIAIYPFDGFTDDLSNESDKPDGTILFERDAFYIKVNGEWTLESNILSNYQTPALLGGGANIFKDRLFRCNNTLYRVDNNYNELIPPISYATENIPGVIKVLGETETNISRGSKNWKGVYIGLDGVPAVYCATNNVILGTTEEGYNSNGYGTISYDESKSITPQINLRIYDGSRDINANFKCLVTEKGLHAVLANKVTAVEGKDLSSNDYTDADKTKLTSLREYTLATNSDIDAIINGQTS